jgi:protein O-mannosyl-transferase
MKSVLKIFMTFIQKNKFFIVCFLLGVLTMALYWPIRSHGFTSFDDGLYVTDCPKVQMGLSWDGICWAFQSFDAVNWHPLTFIVHMIDCDLYGLSPAGHHLTSILFHCANVLLVFLLLRHLTGKFWASAMVSALFAWHPLHVESVVWIAELKDVLSTFFWLLTMLAYVQYVEKPGWISYLSALIFFALGVMSKPMVVTLPCALLLLDYWPLQRFSQKKDQKFEFQFAKFPTAGLSRILLEKVPFFVLSIVGCILTVLAQNRAIAPLEIFPFEPRLINSVISYARYVGSTLWPSDLSLLYPYHVFPGFITCIAIGFVVGMTLFSIWQIYNKPYFTVGWFWFLGTLVPAIGIVQVGSQSMADRYMYIPSIGLFMLIVFAFCDLEKKWHWARTFLSCVGVLALAACFIVTKHQIKYWENDESLFRHALQVDSKNNTLAYLCLGNCLRDENKNLEALEVYKSGLRQNAEWPYLEYQIGILLLDQGEGGKGMDMLKSAFKKQRATERLGLKFIDSLTKGEDDVETIKLLQSAQANQTNSTIFFDLGTLYFQRSKFSQASDAYSEALKLNPTFPEAHGNAGIASMRQGKIQEGIYHFAMAADMNPSNAVFHSNLGMALMKHGAPLEAERQFRICCQLNPANLAYAEQFQKAQARNANQQSVSE